MKCSLLSRRLLGFQWCSNMRNTLVVPHLLVRRRTVLQISNSGFGKKLQGCEAKLLTQAGREILIKAVAQAFPMYTMSCLKLPETLCHEIEALICRCFWRQRGDNRKIHWLKWETMYKLVFL